MSTDRVVSTDNNPIFPRLVMKMCLKNRVPIFSVIENFTVVHWTTNLGLIQDQVNLILREKVGVVLLQETFHPNILMDIDAPSFIEMRDLQVESQTDTEHPNLPDIIGSIIFTTSIAPTSTFRQSMPWPPTGVYVLES